MADLAGEEAPATSPNGSRDGRVRVLWLIKGLGAGGAERLLVMAAQLRSRDDFDCEVAYLLPWKRDLVSSLEEAEVPVHCLFGGSEFNVGWAVRLRKLLLERRFDILHVHSPYVAGIARLAARSLPRSRRPKLMSTEHLPWSGYVLPTRMLNAITFPMDDAHVAVSKAVRESIPPRLARGVHVVVHGVPVERVWEQRRHREEARRELGAGPEELVVGTVAHFRPQKGYLDLLSAARRVLDAGVDARFVAVGHGDQEGEIRARHRQLGLGDRFLLIGYRDNPARVLAGCDLFVLASLYEGLPLAMMEALTLGIPVVATSIPGIQEGVTHDVEALLVPPSRPDLLAEAIVELARDPQRRSRMGRAGRKRAKAFDIRAAVRTTERLYRSVLAGPDGRR
jgi:glycosyltransferase involved in cell wall biosynthesis